MQNQLYAITVNYDEKISLSNRFFPQFPQRDNFQKFLQCDNFQKFSRLIQIFKKFPPRAGAHEEDSAPLVLA